MKSWIRNNWTYCIPGILFLLAMMILPYACPNDDSHKGDNKDNNDIKIENGN